MSDIAEAGVSDRRIFNTGVLGVDSLDYFLPKYICEKYPYKITPVSCILNAKLKNGESRPFFTFTVNWYDSLKRSGGTRKSSRSCSETGKRTRSTSSRRRLCQEISVEPGEHGDVVRRCDGPCGQLRFLNELRIMGRCEHAICSLCTLNAPMVEDADGSMGCCNPMCFAADLASICPNPKQRHRFFQMIINNANIDEIKATYCGKGRRTIGAIDRAVRELSSTSSLESADIGSLGPGNCKEMLEVNLMILECGACQSLRRRRVTEEIGSTTKLTKALERLTSGRGLNIWKGRVFFCKGNDLRGPELLEINLKRFGQAKLRFFVPNAEKLSLALDYSSQLRGNPDSPYM